MGEHSAALAEYEMARDVAKKLDPAKYTKERHAKTFAALIGCARVHMTIAGVDEDEDEDEDEGEDEDDSSEEEDVSDEFEDPPQRDIHLREAMVAAEEALRMAGEHPEHPEYLPMFAQANEMVGKVCFENKATERALEYLETAVDYHRRAEDPFDVRLR
jgi:hypothetical protein